MSRNKDLIAGYLDDSLTESEWERLHIWLKEDAANLREFVLANAREEQLRIAALSLEKTPPIDNIKTTFRSRVILAYAAVSGPVAALAWVIVPLADHDLKIRLVKMSGPVSWQSSNGTGFEFLNSGRHVGSGTLVVEGEGSRAEVAFGDGSTLTLSGGSELVFEEKKGKHLLLQRGSLLANISPQPEGHPMRIRTPTAEALVLGTSFGMNAAKAETFLRVDSGSVELRRLADNLALMVSGGEQSRASVNTTRPMLSESATPVPSYWRADPESAGGVIWLGDWNKPDVLSAVPRIALITSEDVQETHFRAGAINSIPGLVTLQEDSAISVRYRTRRHLNVGVFLSTHAESGEFTGNFETYIEARYTPADANGWRVAKVPMKAFRPVREASLLFQPGTVAGAVFLTTFAADVGLEIAELEVTQ